MGGGESKTEGTTDSPQAGGHWTPEREQWWTPASNTYENISSIEGALTSCHSLMESSWFNQHGFKYLSEH